jgi:hypothetical protein
MTNNTKVTIIKSEAVAMATGSTSSKYFGRAINWSTRIGNVSHEPERKRIHEAPNSPSEKAMESVAATTSELFIKGIRTFVNRWKFEYPSIAAVSS